MFPAVIRRFDAPELANTPTNNSSECKINTLVRQTSSMTHFSYLALRRLSGCFHFNGTTVLPATIEYILVKCKSGAKQLYVNSHAIMRERSDLQKRLNEFREQSIMQPNQADNSEEELVGAEKPRPLSVLMLSIDSISRLNLIRAMPKTAQHVYSNEWFELQGYNKASPFQS